MPVVVGGGGDVEFDRCLVRAWLVASYHTANWHADDINWHAYDINWHAYDIFRVNFAGNICTILYSERKVIGYFTLVS